MLPKNSPAEARGRRSDEPLPVQPFWVGICFKRLPAITKDYQRLPKVTIFGFSEASESDALHGGQFGGDEVAQGIGGIVAAQAFFIWIDFQDVSG
jgi:hypothetical protein